MDPNRMQYFRHHLMDSALIEAVDDPQDWIPQHPYSRRDQLDDKMYRIFADFAGRIRMADFLPIPVSKHFIFIPTSEMRHTEQI